MVGVAALLSLLSGLLFTVLGADPWPLAFGSAVAGVLLAGAALIETRRSSTRRRVLPSSVWYTMAVGLLLIEVPVFIVCLDRLVAAAPGRGRMLWGLAAALSVALILILPLLMLERVRRRRHRARYRVASEMAVPLVWGWRRPYRVLLLLGVLLVVVLALLPRSAGWPPLDLAIRLHSPWGAAWSLDLGADPNRPGPWGAAPLELAVRLGQPAIVALLLARGADPNGRRQPDTPLLAAIATGSPLLVGQLLAGGADPNLAGGRGLPLTLASRRGNGELVDLLLAHGAGVDLRDDSGCTALAAALPTPAVVERLLAAGANPDVFCGERNPEVPGDRVTPLMIAAKRGLEPAALQLLEAGARPTLRSARGRTAGELALEHGQRPLVRLLDAPREPGSPLVRPFPNADAEPP